MPSPQMRYYIIKFWNYLTKREILTGIPPTGRSVTEASIGTGSLWTAEICQVFAK